MFGCVVGWAVHVQYWCFVVIINTEGYVVEVVEADINSGVVVFWFVDSNVVLLVVNVDYVFGHRCVLLHPIVREHDH